jgi:hypothetical protein
MRTHIQLVGIVHILTSAALIGVGVVVMVFFSAIFAALGVTAGTQGDASGAGVLAVMAGLGPVLGCAIALPALPGFLAGFAVMKYRSWSRWVLIVVSALHVFNIPVGTAIAIYTFYVLLNKETEALFENQGAGLDPLV